MKARTRQEKINAAVRSLDSILYRLSQTDDRIAAEIAADLREVQTALRAPVAEDK
jgi:hypothetical protein